MQWATELAGPGPGNATSTGLPADGSLAPVLFGFGALFFIILPVLKFVLAGGAGLFLFRQFDDQFGREGRRTGQVLERTLRRITGEPPDLLDERKLQVRRLNDEVVSFQASLTEQTEGPAAGLAVRSAARRGRFLSSWPRALDSLALSDTERQQVEEAVSKYSKKELERREDFTEIKQAWLAGLLKNSFFAGFWYRFQLAASLDKQLKLQEEVLASVREALPEASRVKLKSIFGNGKSDLSWLVDTTTEGPANSETNRVYVLSFDGDPSAAGVTLLSQEITAIISSPSKPREVVLRLKSPGGTVTGYGLAAAQLLRFREHGIRLVICVDELAASGGYLMACCGDHICCSPFAAIGSIGVISGIPNVTERLGREGLKVIQTTAGKWKRTVDPFQEPTEEALAKAKDDIMMVYRQFADFVKSNRAGVDIDEVATGEVWYGPQALKRGLVDELQTSAEYLQRCIAEGYEVFALSFKEKPAGLAGALGASSGLSANALRLAELLAQGGEGLGGLGGLEAEAAALAAGVWPSSRWPAGATEPRMEAKNPLNGLPW